MSNHESNADVVASACAALYHVALYPQSPSTKDKSKVKDKDKNSPTSTTTNNNMNKSAIITAVLKAVKSQSEDEAQEAVLAFGLQILYEAVQGSCLRVTVSSAGLTSPLHRWQRRLTSPLHRRQRRQYQDRHRRAENKVKLAAAGGIGALLKVMEEFSFDLDVVEQTCGALWSLAVNE